MKSFYSHGKLLISGEYLVLEGAKALAVPCRYGQYLTVKSNDSEVLNWTSLDEQGLPWYRAQFKKRGDSLESESGNEITSKLIEILRTARDLNPGFLRRKAGMDVQTKLEFNREWGLGSSSTLLNNIAMWAGVNAFELSDRTLGGSGYDVACAKSDHPIFYQRIADFPRIEKAPFDPQFRSQLYFLHLNKKQDSRSAIGEFRRSSSVSEKLINRISVISETMAGAINLAEFRRLMEEHEHLMSGVLNSKPVKERLFNDFGGSIKSLGAWGGDFVMIASETDPRPYFRERGYFTLLPFDKMVL